MTITFWHLACLSLALARMRPLRREKILKMQVNGRQTCRRLQHVGWCSRMCACRQMGKRMMGASARIAAKCS